MSVIGKTRSTFKASKRLLVLLIAQGFTPGCDPALVVEGEAYEWLDPPVGAESFVIIGDQLSDSLEVEPLRGVLLSVWTQNAYSSYMRRQDQDPSIAPIDEVMEPLERGSTRESGKYFIQRVTYPAGSGGVVLTARKEGCDSAEAELTGYSNEATVVLVCD